MAATLPEWASEGKQVFVRTRNSIYTVTIVRVTATLIIDDRGNRYRIASMSRSINDWESARLVPIDDPAAIRAAQEQIADSRARAIAEVGAKFGLRQHRTKETLEELEAAISAWRQAAETLAALSD